MKKDLNYKTVDIGLPSGLLWANKNVGAETKADAGLYFAWGDTVGYTAEQVGVDKEFLWKDYKFGDYFEENLSKYFPGVDKLTKLQPEDDAVIQFMGGDWRMPTKEDFQELIEYTEAYLVSKNGKEIPVEYKKDYASGLEEFSFFNKDTISGIKLYNLGSKSTYLFFPSTGIANENVINNDFGIHVWCADALGYKYAYSFSIYPDLGHGGIGTCQRFMGQTLRGVKLKK